MSFYRTFRYPQQFGDFVIIETFTFQHHYFPLLFRKFIYTIEHYFLKILSEKFVFNRQLFLNQRLKFLIITLFHQFFTKHIVNQIFSYISIKIQLYLDFIPGFPQFYECLLYNLFCILLTNQSKTKISQLRSIHFKQSVKCLSFTWFKLL